MSASIVVPVSFGDLEVLVEIAPTTVGGSEDVGLEDRVRATYKRAEPAILAVADHVAGTVRKLRDGATRPSQVQVELGVGFTAGGEMLLLKGEATLSITLTYDIG